MRVHCACVLFSLVLAGCGDPRGTGFYEIDKDFYATSMADYLIEIGELDSSSRADFMDRIRTTKYTLDLRPDLTFVGVIERESTKMRFRGTWQVDGVNIAVRPEQGRQGTVGAMHGTLMDGVIRVRTWDAASKRNFQLRFREAMDPAAAPR